MFIPIHDANSLKYIKHQYVTLAIIAVNVAAYAFIRLGGAEFAERADVGLGYIPAVDHDFATLPPDLALVPLPFTYLTYAFLHGGFLHLAGNMLFLWVFGDNVEDALGHVRYLVFYLACAAAGAFAHGLIAPESQAPLIGASGAIAGIIAAYLILHPRVKIWVLAFYRIPLRIPAYIVLALWIVTQFAWLLLDRDNAVSFAAHAGGIIAGAILVLVLRRRGVPLFDRRVETPRAVETEPPRPQDPDGIPGPWG